MYRNAMLLLLCGFLAPILCIMPTPAWSQSPADAAEKGALGKAAIAGYAANMNSFTYYQCRYRHTKAEARSVEAAIRGDFLNARSYDNRLIVDGDRELYEGFAPPPDFKQGRKVPGKKGVSVSSPGHSDKYLADGKREMNYLPPLQSINLFSIEKKSHGIDVTPLGMNFVGHRSRNGPDVKLREPDLYEFSVDGVQEIDGRPVVTVRFKKKQAFRQGTPQEIRFSYSYSFDNSKGCLPVRMALLWNDRPKTQVFVTHIRECSNSRWFPERTIAVDTPDKPGALYDVSELKLLELDADHRPDKSAFFFNIPASTTVSEFGNPDGRHFKLKQDEKISIEDLPTLFEMKEQSANNPLMDTAIPHNSVATWVRWSVGLAGLILVSGGAWFLVRRFRLRRAPT